MEIKYQCGLPDYLEAQYAHYRRSPVYYATFACIFVFGVALGIYQLATEGYPEGVLPIAVVVFWVLLRFVYRPLCFRREFRKSPNFIHAQTLRADETGLLYTSDLGKSDVRWNAFTKFRETPNLFMLYFGGRLFQVVPKRAFSGTTLEEFRALLEHNVAGKMV